MTMRLNHVTLIITDLEASRDEVWARLERAGLRDPDGHQIRLYNAGANRLNPPWRID